MTRGCRAAKLPDPPTAVNILTLLLEWSGARSEAGAPFVTSPSARIHVPMTSLRAF